MCDYISKVGTKQAAMKVNAIHYLNGFGHGLQLTEDEEKKAEEFLAKVYSHTSGLTTFDELRVRHFLKNNSISNLPPTSKSVKTHILRWWYLTKVCSSLLSNTFDDLNPLEYGWYKDEEDLLPVKNLSILPEEYTCKCSCKGDCSTKRCKCKKLNSICTLYCFCNFPCANTKRKTL